MGQSWAGIGGTINVPELTDLVRIAAQDVQGFAQVVNPPTGEALGRNRGDTVQYTYFGNLSTTGGRLSENEEIPEGSIVPISGSYLIYEYGNSTKYTGKLETLSRLPIEDTFVQALVNDMRKAQNTAAYDEIDATSWKAAFIAAGDEFKKTGTLVGTADQDLSLANLRFVVRQARKNLIPYYDGESYLYISGIDSIDALRYDSTVTTMLQYDSGYSALNGEIGRVAQCRLIEDTHKVAKIGSTEFDTGYLIGGDAIVNEYALAPEIRVMDKDFGRSLQVAWFFMAGWKKIYSNSVHSKEHVIKVTSA